MPIRAARRRSSKRCSPGASDFRDYKAKWRARSDHGLCPKPLSLSVVVHGLRMILVRSGLTGASIRVWREVVRLGGRRILSYVGGRRRRSEEWVGGIRRRRGRRLFL